MPGPWPLPNSLPIGSATAVFQGAVPHCSTWVPHQDPVGHPLVKEGSGGVRPA